MSGYQIAMQEAQRAKQAFASVGADSPRTPMQAQPMDLSISGARQALADTHQLLSRIEDQLFGFAPSGASPQVPANIPPITNLQAAIQEVADTSHQLRARIAGLMEGVARF